VQGLGLELRGKTLGIVGPGRIGAAVARIGAGGFGMRVAYTGTRRCPELESALGALALDLDMLLAEADVVSLHAPLAAATRGLIGRERLARMKPGAILVNTARGPLVDEAALVEGLRSGRPAAAGLDVYAEEPAVPAALRELPNVVLLPHLGSATRETRGRMIATAADNVVAVLHGEAPPNAVNRPGLRSGGGRE
jgi:lactate dehydrogenase-like 2-hydroxyacid dehydrogenase